MMIQQGVDFVLWCLEHMCGGELFVPKLPSMNIMDLARAIAPDCRTKIIGIRPGEKLHEVLIPREEARNSLEFDNYYIIQPQFPFWGERSNWSEGRRVPEDFEYNSGTNPWRLSGEEMREMVRQYEVHLG